MERLRYFFAQFLSLLKNRDSANGKTAQVAVQEAARCSARLVILVATGALDQVVVFTKYGYRLPNRRGTINHAIPIRSNTA